MPTNPSKPSAHLHVCPLADVHDTIVRSGAAHLITVINRQTMLETPALIAPERHLKIAVNDINTPQDGLVHPSAEHVDQVIAFARTWDRSGPMVVHCWAGISRSTAAAFISLCTLNRPGTEHDIAQAIRSGSATATPNRLMVALADAALQRNGRMIEAVHRIGQGQMAMSGTPFAITSHFD